MRSPITALLSAISLTQGDQRNQLQTERLGQPDFRGAFAAERVVDLLRGPQLLDGLYPFEDLDRLVQTLLDGFHPRLLELAGTSRPVGAQKERA